MTSLWTLRCVAATALLTNACNGGAGGTPPTDVILGQITAKDVSNVAVDGDGNYLPPLAGPGTGVIVQKLTPEVIDLSEYISQACAITREPDYPSEQGLSPIRLTTSTQDLVAVYEGDRYRVDGLVADAAYDTDDESLEIAYDGAEPFSEMVQAPPALNDPNDHLGPRDGLATEVRMPDGEFDVVVVSISASDGVNPYDVDCTYTAESMAMANGVRATPMVDSDARDELASRGIVAINVIVSIDNQMMSDRFFPGAEPIALRAGRAVSLSAASLTVPEPGACTFPTIVPLDVDGLGKLCFNQGPELMMCTVTSGACPDFDTYFEFSLMGAERMVYAGAGLQASASSHGAVNPQSNAFTGLPDETDITLSAVDFNGNTFTANIRFSGRMVSIGNLTVQ